VLPPVLLAQRNPIANIRKCELVIGSALKLNPT